MKLTEAQALRLADLGENRRRLHQQLQTAEMFFRAAKEEEHGFKMGVIDVDVGDIVRVFPPGQHRNSSTRGRGQLARVQGVEQIRLLDDGELDEHPALYIALIRKDGGIALNNQWLSGSRWERVPRKDWPAIKPAIGGVET